MSASKVPLTTLIMRCLICDAAHNPFRRIRPHKIYACEPCVKRRGGTDAILAEMDHHVQAFINRHNRQAVA